MNRMVGPMNLDSLGSGMFFWLTPEFISDHFTIMYFVFLPVSASAKSINPSRRGPRQPMVGI